MTAQIQTLIDKKDTFELVRDQIVQILTDESANQVQLATTAGKPDPNQWALSVYDERSNPWNVFRNDTPDNEVNDIPIVNVWYDSSSFNKGSSNQTSRQDTTGIFNIDIYGYGRSENNPAGGHFPGDQAAALKAQQGVRLVRNILMASAYRNLRFPKGSFLVSERWVQAINAFQPDQDSKDMQNIAALRLSFAVRFNELSPQYVAENIEIIFVELQRESDGKVIAQIQIDST